jgi:membrane protein
MKPHELARRAIRFLTQDIWLMDLTNAGTWKRRGVDLARNLYLSYLRFQQARCYVRASSLTTVTLISVVPVLAFAFSIAKGFGAHQDIQIGVLLPALDNWLGSEQAPELREAIDQLFLFVENTDLSSLGAMGFLTVVYAVIRLLGSIEEAFNDLWRVPSSRQLVRKFTDYMSVSIVVPLFLFIAAMATSALQSGTSQHFYLNVLGWGDMGAWLLRLLALPLVWLGFALTYQVMPNTSIKFRSALHGGILGGTLWLVIHSAHVHLQVGVASYNAIYAGFSAFPIFTIWIFFSWVAVLVGASFASALQTKDEHREKVIRASLCFSDRERMALRVASLLARRFASDEGELGLDEICQLLSASDTAVEVAIADLKIGGLVAETEDSDVLLSRDPARIRLYDVLSCVKGAPPPVDSLPMQPDALHARRAIANLEEGLHSLPSNLSLAVFSSQILALDRKKA